MGRALDEEELGAGAGPGDGVLAERERRGLAAGDHQQRARGDLVDVRVGVELVELVDAAQHVPVGGARVVAARRPVVVVELPRERRGRVVDRLGHHVDQGGLLTDFSAVPRDHRTYAWLLFSDPALRHLHTQWADVARDCVAMLRRKAGRHPQDQPMQRLVGELSIASDDFRHWWGDHRVARRTRGSKALRHPVAGELTLDWDALSCAGDPGQQLVVWTAEPGTPSHDALRLLASWNATTPSPTAPHGRHPSGGPGD
ncbi:hypothetical protein ACFV3R_30425 [Streptomyces sp. NPDC059740]|uniref:MmyB family transcriptional regulator n=1 Tax=Streptomyces sp. NPDC059740 TaxID=3346926 RepID=UPI00365ADD39